LYETAPSSTPEIAYLTEAVSHVSDIQAQNSFLLRALISENKIKVCKDFEEEEGRINCDLLNRLIIVGGPLIQPGPGMQDQLVRQVCINVTCSYFYPIYQVRVELPAATYFIAAINSLYSKRSRCGYKCLLQCRCCLLTFILSNYAIFNGQVQLQIFF